jgi:hypothetical protein
LSLPKRYIEAILSEEDYEKQRFCYQLSSTPTQTIEPNVVYRDRNTRQIKFLLLPKAISVSPYLTALEALNEADWTKGGRTANGQVLFGKKITLGWMKLQYPGYDNMRTAPTLEQPKLLAAVSPLVRKMDELVEANIPEYHNYAFTCAMTATRPTMYDPETGLIGDEDDLTRIADPVGYKVVKSLDPWNMTYTVRGTVFSSVELNRNIVFKAHEDGNNVEGTMVCITTLGDFVGGRLMFPRYGYAAELTPYDLLICDNNHELHGNFGPIVGQRFSVVAFLHNSVFGKEDRKKYATASGEKINLVSSGSE